MKQKACTLYIIPWLSLESFHRVTTASVVSMSGAEQLINPKKCHSLTGQTEGMGNIKEKENWRTLNRYSCLFLAKKPAEPIRLQSLMEIMSNHKALISSAAAKLWILPCVDDADASCEEVLDREDVLVCLPTGAERNDHVKICYYLESFRT